MAIMPDAICRSRLRIARSSLVNCRAPSVQTKSLWYQSLCHDFDSRVARRVAIPLKSATNATPHATRTNPRAVRIRNWEIGWLSMDTASFISPQQAAGRWVPPIAGSEAVTTRVERGSFRL
jgi:hypothetical protein